MNKGTLFLIPAPLGATPIDEIMPETVKKTVAKLRYFIVENEKTARRFIKQICPEKKQSELVVYQLNKHDKTAGLDNFIKPLLAGEDIGLLSEAGLPAIADPGGLVVAMAHRKQVPVKPLCGPSSLMLALMSSGLNGQNFSFEGYLPKEQGALKKQIKLLEKRSLHEKKSIICIETPYRNNKLFQSFIKYLHADTRLCVASDLTLPTEFIKTLPVNKWRQHQPDLHKRPTVFIFQSR